MSDQDNVRVPNLIVVWPIVNCKCPLEEIRIGGFWQRRGFFYRVHDGRIKRLVTAGAAHLDIEHFAARQLSNGNNGYRVALKTGRQVNVAANLDCYFRYPRLQLA